MIRVAVITISDSGAAGMRTDISGETAESVLTDAGLDVAVRDMIPDDRTVIADRLRSFCARTDIDAVFTTGGTGLGPRDVTPEATRDVIHREIPGMAEAMRLEGMQKTPYAMLSRQVVGVCGQTLIVNLPGSPKAVREGLQVTLPVIPHLVSILKGDTEHRASQGAE